MAVAILIIGVGAGLSLSAALWAMGFSVLLIALAYPLGGTLGCLLAGIGLALCRGRAEAGGYRAPTSATQS